ncbi:hypothetical protein ACIBG6_07690 [Streptomyces sp. NPDC050842]|uniref:hypothetical protein n=1 Tax=Streptomyces sp. NPDC050842 TaxID=3365636 RepID=UPI0037BC6A1D
MAKKKQRQGSSLTSVPRAIERGVKIAMGTDCGIAAHGNNLRELGHLVDCGTSGPVRGPKPFITRPCPLGE